MTTSHSKRDLFSKRSTVILSHPRTWFPEQRVYVRDTIITAAVDKQRNKQNLWGSIESPHFSIPSRCRVKPKEWGNKFELLKCLPPPSFRLEIHSSVNWFKHAGTSHTKHFYRIPNTCKQSWIACFYKGLCQMTKYFHIE